MGVRDEDEDEDEEDDDEKRSQRLGMVRTDTRTSADEIGVRESRRRCKTRRAWTWRQSVGWTSLRKLGPSWLRPPGAGINTQRRDAYQLARQRELLREVPLEWVRELVPTPECCPDLSLLPNRTSPVAYCGP